MKKAVLWVLGLVAVVCVGLCGVSLLMSPEWNVTASVVIDAPPAKIHPYINRPRTWVAMLERYGQQVDPEAGMQFTFGEIDEGVGAWFRSEAGASVARIEYLASDPETGIEYEGMIDSEEVNSRGSLTYEVVEGGTQVTWNDTGSLPTGAGLFAPVLEMQLVPFFGGILGELKTAVEAGEAIPDRE